MGYTNYALAITRIVALSLSTCRAPVAGLIMHGEWYVPRGLPGPATSHSLILKSRAPALMERYFFMIASGAIA